MLIDIKLPLILQWFNANCTHWFKSKVAFSGFYPILATKQTQRVDPSTHSPGVLCTMETTLHKEWGTWKKVSKYQTILAQSEMFYCENVCNCCIQFIYIF